MKQSKKCIIGGAIALATLLPSCHEKTVNYNTPSYEQAYASVLFSDYYQEIKNIKPQNQKRDIGGFIRVFMPYANRIAVKPSIAIAQACLTTDYGCKVSAPYNYWGFAPKNGETSIIRSKEVIIDGKSKIVDCKFRAFENIDQSIKEYNKKILERIPEELKNSLMDITVEETMFHIQNEQNPFAQDKNYTKKILSIIKRYDLEKLDEIVKLYK